MSPKLFAGPKPDKDKLFLRIYIIGNVEFKADLKLYGFRCLPTLNDVEEWERLYDLDSTDLFCSHFSELICKPGVCFCNETDIENMDQYLEHLISEYKKSVLNNKYVK